MYLDCRLLIIPSVPLNFLLVKARAVIYGWKTYLLAKCFASCGALRYALFLLFRFIIRTFSSVSFFNYFSGFDVLFPARRSMRVRGCRQEGCGPTKCKTHKPRHKSFPYWRGWSHIQFVPQHAYVSYHHFLIIQRCSFSISFFIT
jgi:hypothetical protein